MHPRFYAEQLQKAIQDVEYRSCTPRPGISTFGVCNSLNPRNWILQLPRINSRVKCCSAVGVRGAGFRAQGLVSRLCSLGLAGLGLEALGLGFGVYGLGFGA